MNYTALKKYYILEQHGSDHFISHQQVLKYLHRHVDFQETFIFIHGS